MKLGILTSSRADFGIYLPLLNRMRKENVDFELIVFGTHLDHNHGYTIDEILKNGFEVRHKVETMPANDSVLEVSRSIGSTVERFSDFWSDHKVDFSHVICLGDRFEMYAAVLATVPFGIKLVHIHGGETSLGAIDNKYRHSLSVFSDIHFTSHPEYANRVSNIVDSNKDVYCVGALSLDSLQNFNLQSIDEFKEQWGIDLSRESVLFTYHPETAGSISIQQQVEVLVDVLKQLPYQVVITMPNADPDNNVIRDSFTKLASEYDNIIAVNNFGTLSYFSCIKHCKFIMGNSSSGIIEAASFDKYVINLGDRQKGRLCGKNVIHCRLNKDEILKEVAKVESLPTWDQGNIYWKGGASETICNTLKKMMTT